MTGDQIRAARAMLRMEQLTLATRAGVSVDTVKRLERLDGELSGKSNESTLRAIEGELLRSGVMLTNGGVMPTERCKTDAEYLVGLHVDFEKRSVTRIYGKLRPAKDSA